jgi:hypothetical protein
MRHFNTESGRYLLRSYRKGGGNGVAKVLVNGREPRWFWRSRFVDAGCQRLRRSALVGGLRVIGRSTGRCSSCMTLKGQENSSRWIGAGQWGRRRVLGGRRLWRGDRPARAAWLYVMRLVHGPDKSGERLSERPISALGASISWCSSTLTHIPKLKDKRLIILKILSIVFFLNKTS